MRRAALAALVLAGLAPPSAAARRPVLAYVDGTGTFKLYDAETGTAVPPPAEARRPVRGSVAGTGGFRLYGAEGGGAAPPPALPSGLNASFRRVSVSHNGRFVVYVANQTIHLVDRASNLEKRLPGLPAI